MPSKMGDIKLQMSNSVNNSLLYPHKTETYRSNEKQDNKKQKISMKARNVNIHKYKTEVVYLISLTNASCK